MKCEDISKAVGDIDTRYIEEAADYEASNKLSVFFKKRFVKPMIAAAAALCLLLGGIGVFSPVADMNVTVYASGTNERITDAGVAIDTGTIKDAGEMIGYPLTFYLSGKKIDKVRFSCKNQQISFVDCTEKRHEYGNAQNFTIPYGKDSSEYSYLLINWEPNATIKELTENNNSTIATLPAEMREDIIVMEITFMNRKTVTKAITVKLLNNGTFFATVDDYEISETDTFVKRADDKCIPRDIYYEEPTNEPVDYSKNPPSFDPGTVKASPNSNREAILEKTKKVALDYYNKTVFKVESMKLISLSEKEAFYSVYVSKGGDLQEMPRTITLNSINGEWEVTNEGY